MKYRHEYKYVIDARQEAILRVRIGGLLDVAEDGGNSCYHIGMSFRVRYFLCNCI